MKEVGGFIVLTKEEFEKYQKAYEQYEHRKETSRIYMRAKYARQKQEREKDLESQKLEQSETEILQSILEHEHQNS